MLTFTPHADRNGTETVIISVSDSLNASLLVNLTLVVYAVNDIPAYNVTLNLGTQGSVNDTLLLFTIPEDGLVYLRFLPYDNDTFTAFNYTKNISAGLTNLTVTFAPRSVYGDNVTLRLINNTALSSPTVSSSYYEVNVSFNQSINNSDLLTLLANRTELVLNVSLSSALQIEENYTFYQNMNGGISRDLFLQN